MLKKQIDVAIIGTGTAALAAAAEVRRVTKNFIIVSNGVYGTTCVRNGCMPAKMLFHAAELNGLCRSMRAYGFHGTEQLRLDTPAMFAHLHRMRADFLSYTLKLTERWKPYMVEGPAWFHSPTEIEVVGTVYQARRVILATGSSPNIPDAYQTIADRVFTSDTIFEQTTLPASIAVIGMTMLGTEIAHALAGLGVRVVAIAESAPLGCITSPTMNEYVLKTLRTDMEVWVGPHRWERTQHGIRIATGDTSTEVEAVFLALSRCANLEGMNLEACGIRQENTAITDYNPQTMQVRDLPVFVAGDVKSGRSILNETADEGRIAGHNAVRDVPERFIRRTPMQICYTNPTLAIVGQTHGDMSPGTFVTGTASYDDQGRAKILGMNRGMIEIYANRADGRLLGAEIFAPGGEHLAHLLASWVECGLTVETALTMPFYHPTLEEGIQSALREAADKLALPHLAASGLRHAALCAVG